MKIEPTAATILTRRGVKRSSIHCVLTQDNGEPSVEMVVNVTVEEPRARVVGREPDSDIVTCSPRTDGVALRRVHVVVVGAACAADDVEGVLRVKVVSRIQDHVWGKSKTRLTPCKWKG